MPRCHLGVAGKMTGYAGGNNYIIAFAHVLGRQPRLLLVYISVEDNLCGCPLRYKINSSLLFFEKLFQELVHLFVKVLQKILTQDERVIIDYQQIDN